MDLLGWGKAPRLVAEEFLRRNGKILCNTWSLQVSMSKNSTKYRNIHTVKTVSNHAYDCKQCNVRKDEDLKNWLRFDFLVWKMCNIRLWEGNEYVYVLCRGYRLSSRRWLWKMALRWVERYWPFLEQLTRGYDNFYRMKYLSMNKYWFTSVMEMAKFRTKPNKRWSNVGGRSKLTPVRECH
jgi:hypothetical protein